MITVDVFEGLLPCARYSRYEFTSRKRIGVSVVCDARGFGRWFN